MTPFSWPVRVYWEDTDGGGIVYYANYLKFLERARTEWLRARGHGQQDIARERGLIFTVVHLDIAYQRPAKLDDELLVSCEPQPEGGATLLFRQAITRGAQTLVDARVRVACLDAGTLKPKRLPEFLTRHLAGELA
ncbi:MAG: tol-pal system-associated acyl-CoA thioesterase [Steroidobacteraceae bacterium]